MMDFKQFLLIESQEADLKKTLRKLPKRHRALIRGYTWRWQNNNELKGDVENIGELDQEKKRITIASPWNYGREYTSLHEIGHLVWENLVDEKLRDKWRKIVEKTKNKQNQSAEELFCMAYANHFAKNKIVIHTHNAWERFISNLPK